MSRDKVQGALDDEEAAQLLRRILRLRDVKDAAEEDVTRLTRELAQAKRQHREAGWNLAAAEQSARERVARAERG